MLPEVTTTTEDISIEDIQVGNPGEIDPEEIDSGKGGAICDIDVGNAKPVAQRVRKVAPQFREKLSQLLKGLLSARIIQNSTSPWASPIVVIIEKNGIDIRLCIGYRLINSLTRLMVYPMPLINDLLGDLDKVLWYCSLDMTSGFWVVSMTDRARMISAFITPFGLFEWNRMPFGLKNAPQIYQRLIDNALYGFLKITNTQDRQAKNDPNESNLVDLFKEGEPDEDKPTSVLGRRSYVDDILVTAGSWEILCEKVDKLLDACDEWNLSISVVKSFWGMKKVDYLGHRVSADGMEARPKDLSSLANLPFPTTLRSMQSFLGSLNYYSRFIEDFAVYASILYELREADFFAATRRSKINPEVGLTGGDDSQPGCEGKWVRAMTAFTVLKDKLVRAPILRQFDPDRRPVVVVYASKWAISAALMQDHKGVYQPVTFTSRTLKPNEINYGVVDKEVLALLRILDVCYTQLVTRSIKVSTRHSTLAWLVNSSGRHGRLGRWAALLSGWTLEIVKCTKGEDEILGVMAASITPREEVDAILTTIAPRKQPRQAITMLPPTVELDEKLLVVSFDGSARVKRSGGAFSAVVWSLPEWTVISAASKYKTDLTVTEAEYHGMLLCFDLLSELDRGRLIVCGDSNLVFRQMRGEIECKAPSLKLLRQKAMERLRSWPDHAFLHVKRDWNQSADRLAGAALQREDGTVVVSDAEREGLATLNRLDELLVPRTRAAVVKIAAVARPRRRLNHEVLQETLIQRLRMERIAQAQDEEKWIVNLKKFILGDVQGLTSAEAKSCAKIAEDYEVDEAGLLFYCPPSKQANEDRDQVTRLVIPERIQEDFLHH
ncbi:hypothetical protein PR002_g23640 [Phytophthora rubi]|uniref:Reverse transcriptase domain-containing protein n=1 Tax=Phytophthora rubi TaxID=129364 RepID=A0A6A3INH1_9STRA|nr:hypothetical protein PR002_g23640 [Phytophthora rubi]